MLKVSLFVSCCEISGDQIQVTHFPPGKDLCKEDPNYEIAQTQLKTIENDFHNAKLKAELRIGNLKKTGGAELELLEKEYNNFVRNYTALMHLIEEKPAFCEKVIQELRVSLNHAFVPGMEHINYNLHSIAIILFPVLHRLLYAALSSRVGNTDKAH